MLTKSVLKSKTIGFNALLILGGLYLPDLSESLRIILITTGLSNIGLRLKTKEGLSFKKDKNAPK